MSIDLFCSPLQRIQSMVTQLEHQKYIMVEKLEAEESSWFLDLQESRMKGKVAPLMSLPLYSMWASTCEIVLSTLVWVFRSQSVLYRYALPDIPEVCLTSLCASKSSQVHNKDQLSPAALRDRTHWAQIQMFAAVAELGDSVLVRSGLFACHCLKLRTVTWDAEGKERKGGMKCRTEGKGQQRRIELPLHEPGKGICVI